MFYFLSFFFNNSNNFRKLVHEGEGGILEKPSLVLPICAVTKSAKITPQKGNNTASDGSFVSIFIH